MSKQRRIIGRLLRVAAVSGIALGAMAPSAAHAACYPNACTNPAQVDPGSTQVLPSTISRSASLPFTGGDAAGLAAIGVGAIAAGTVFVRQSRRRVSV